MQSCKQSDILEESSISETLSTDKFLTFDNYEDFDKVLLDLRTNNKGIQDLVAYSNSQNFYSMANFYQKVQEEQEKHNLWLESLSDEDYAQLEKTNPEKLNYSDFVRENKTLLRFDQYNNPLLNVYDPALAALISPQGIVKIGNVLYYYNYRGIKTYLRGNAAHINELIQAKQETDYIKIFQNAVKEVPLISYEKLNIITNDCSQSNYCFTRGWTGGQSSGSRMIQVFSGRYTQRTYR
ncbi:MAG: hypothetical protein NW226_01390 [Microscillaceae bacterium]|nr:hypothetical protein [Microscillaceae bacterium]